MSKRRADARPATDALVVPSTGTRISVPRDATEDDIDELVIGHPELVARAERIRQRRAAGQRGKKGTPNGRLLLRLPLSVHQELTERAKDEGVSVNQLVLHYVSRGLGAEP